MFLRVVGVVAEVSGEGKSEDEWNEFRI